MPGRVTSRSLGAAAALAMLDRHALESNVPLATWLVPLWQAVFPEQAGRGKILELHEEGRQRLRHSLASGFQNLEGLFA